MSQRDAARRENRAGAELRNRLLKLVRVVELERRPDPSKLQELPTPPDSMSQVAIGVPPSGLVSTKDSGSEALAEM